MASSPRNPTYWGEAVRESPESAVLDPSDQRGLKNRFIHLIHRRALEEVLSGTTVPAALDFGCGTGRMIPLLLAHSDRVTGIDFSQEMLNSAAVNVGQARIDLQVCDGKNLPVETGHFDVTLCVWVIQYLVSDPSCRPLFRQLVQSLKPGGRLILLEQARTFRRGWQSTRQEYEQLFGGLGMTLRSERSVRNGRDLLTYLVRYGCVPKKMIGAAVRLESFLASSLPPMPWNPYRDVLLVFEKSA